MSQNKCSIIIRTKNEERWISNCLDKIFSQSYKNFEVILVDNNSSDKTVEKSKIGQASCALILDLIAAFAT